MFHPSTAEHHLHSLNCLTSGYLTHVVVYAILTHLNTCIEYIQTICHYSSDLKCTLLQDSFHHLQRLRLLGWKKENKPKAGVGVLLFHSHWSEIGGPSCFIVLLLNYHQVVAISFSKFVFVGLNLRIRAELSVEKMRWPFSYQFLIRMSECCMAACAHSNPLYETPVQSQARKGMVQQSLGSNVVKCQAHDFCPLSDFFSTFLPLFYSLKHFVTSLLLKKRFL